jgi:signal transduction histidine kinase
MQWFTYFAGRKLGVAYNERIKAAVAGTREAGGKNMSVTRKNLTGSTAVNYSTAAPPHQENLHRLDQLANLGLIAASVAHEIKNGLVAINTFTELSLEKAEDRELATLVRRELKRIDTLVTQMLRFSALKPATFATVNIHDLLEHSVRLLEHELRTRKIGLKRVFEAAPATVRGDEGQLQQAFMNLLLNAMEAIGRNGELTVKTEVTPVVGGPKIMRIHFTDTGAGIAPENLAKVFEPFFTTKKNGTGLGLAICQRIAQEHQGGIELHSEPGRGTTFIVSLAAAD